MAQIARSVYHYWIKKLESKNGVYNKLVNLIKKIVHDNKMRYGYRRVTLTLKKLGFIINHKKVLRSWIYCYIKSLCRIKYGFSRW